MLGVLLILPKPERHMGQVAFVVDGDTLKISTAEPLVRLWGVDAPEKNEKGFQRAKIALKHLAEDKVVSFTKVDQDKYGRLVARVFLSDGTEINRILITEGFADEYCRYSKGFYGQCNDDF